MRCVMQESTALKRGASQDHMQDECVCKLAPLGAQRTEGLYSIQARQGGVQLENMYRCPIAVQPHVKTTSTTFIALLHPWVHTLHGDWATLLAGKTSSKPCRFTPTAHLQLAPTTARHTLLLRLACTATTLLGTAASASLETATCCCCC